MTTRKEDAESIVGELADELEEQAKLVGKSEALVIKAEEEPGEPSEEKPEVEVVSSDTGSEEDEDEKDKKAKKEPEVAKSDATPVEKMYGEPEVEPGWKPYGGATSLKEAQAVVDAKKEQWRVQDLWWMFQDVTNNIMSDPEVKDKGKAIAAASNEFKTLLGQETSKAMFGLLTTLSQVDHPKPEPHPLDHALDALRAEFDKQIATGLGSEDILRALQEPYSAIGETLRSVVGNKPEAPEVTEQKALDTVLSRMEQLSQSVNLISARLDGLSRPAPIPNEPPATPVRRSIDPRLALTPPQVQQVQSSTPKLRDLINRTT